MILFPKKKKKINVMISGSLSMFWNQCHAIVVVSVENKKKQKIKN